MKKMPKGNAVDAAAAGGGDDAAASTATATATAIPSIEPRKRKQSSAVHMR